MKHWPRRTAVMLGGLAIGGFLIAASGIVPIKASSGHWAITDWFLHFAMRRSIATQSLGIESPALDEPGLVLKGAGHYETGCAPCHGSPQRPPTFAEAMTPRPPHLPPRLSEWSPDDLFYVVKHGVKFTGMPGWSALGRDDEVWAMVAFLRKLPSLAAEDYRWRRMARTRRRRVPPIRRQRLSQSRKAVCVVTVPTAEVAAPARSRSLRVSGLLISPPPWRPMRAAHVTAESWSRLRRPLVAPRCAS